MAREWRSSRVFVPAGVVVVSLAAALNTPSLAGAQNPSLPVVSPLSIIQQVLSAKPTPISGTIVINSALLGSAAQSLSSLAGGITLPTGTSTINVWSTTTGAFRAQVLNPQSERDVYFNGTTGWVWDSSTQSAVKVAVPTTTPASVPKLATTQGVYYNPKMLAESILKHVGRATRFQVGKPAYIGGEAAYNLILSPSVGGSLFRSIHIYTSQQTGAILGIDVISSYTSSSVLSLYYTNVSFSTPASSIFDFTPPAGAKVTTAVLPSKPVKSSTTPSVGTQQSEAAGKLFAGASSDKAFSTVGSGWSTVVVSQPGAYASLLQQVTRSDPQYSGLLTKAFTPISTPQGEGKILTTPLLNVLVLPNGQILAGTVSTQVIVADAGLF